MLTLRADIGNAAVQQPDPAAPAKPAFAWSDSSVTLTGGSANLNLMIKAARKAGRSLVKDFREVENLQVSSKGPGDFVSKADIEAERIIKEELMGGRPTYGWLGEETGGEDGADPTRRWIVDPLDGTTNFLHGMPHWAISIALEHKGEIVSAVVYDPAKDEMFWAEKGAGAWLNDNRRLRVSGRRSMSEAVFATGVPFGAKKTLPATLADLVGLVEGLGPRGSLRVLRSPYGHDAFLKETDRIDAILANAIRIPGETA
mgnify:CR=1 FL=1